MNQDPRSVQLNFSGLGCWLQLLLIGLLLISVGLGWVVKGFFVLIAIAITLPIIGWFGFRWWVKRNLVESNCPVCNYEFTGFNKTSCRCPNCNEPLQVENGKFKRDTPPGTIDVSAVEVEAKSLEE